jgi:hypothetical protein
VRSRLSAAPGTERGIGSAPAVPVLAGPVLAGPVLAGPGPAAGTALRAGVPAVVSVLVMVITP